MALTTTPSAPSSRSRSPASSCSGQRSAPPNRGARAPPATASLRMRPGSARAVPRAPARLQRSRDRLGLADGQLARLVGVQEVDLVEGHKARHLPRSDLLEHRVHRGDDAPPLLRLRRIDQRPTIRSASTVSSSVAWKASTSWCGSLRMKPTVSVTRYWRPWWGRRAWSGRACGRAFRPPPPRPR